MRSAFRHRQLPVKEVETLYLLMWQSGCVSISLATSIYLDAGHHLARAQSMQKMSRDLFLKPLPPPPSPPPCPHSHKHTHPHPHPRFYSPPASEHTTTHTHTHTHTPRSHPLPLHLGNRPLHAAATLHILQHRRPHHQLRLCGQPTSCCCCCCSPGG